MPKAMEGIRILEAGQRLAGPMVGMLLGDLGAEVIRYEEPTRGDPLRHAYTPLINGVGPYFLWTARNKKSITLDTRQKRGQEIFKELVRISDVVTENFRPGTMAKWGLAYEDLKKVNSKIIMLSVSMYGHSGPYSRRGGVDHIAQAASGLMSVTGEPDGPATFYGIALVDYVAGLLNTYAVQAALYHREKTGEGQWIDNSLFDSAVWLMEHKILQYTYLGEVAWRKGSRGLSPLERSYPAQDGDVFIMAGIRRGDVLTAIGREDVKEDPRYPKNPRDPVEYEFLEMCGQVLAEWTRTRTVKEIMDTLLAADIMAAPVNTVADAVDDPHWLARGNLVSVEHPDLGTLKFQATPPKFSRTQATVETPPPRLGEHNQYVYGQLLGLSQEEIKRLKEERVI
ncbi:MAG: CoA transferase [Chloroflexi bacterium]|nr:CoA transferase [Chloroflexota bacterium]